MPKLLQINSTLNLGSTGRITEQIATLASNRGWDCFIAYGGRYVNSSEHEKVPVSSRLDNYVHAFEGMFLGRHGLGSYHSTLSFIERIKIIQPDIIHLHNIHGYFINYPLLFKYLRTAGTPIVWTLHDCWAITGHCTHFDSIGCIKWKTGCFDCPLRMHQYKSLFCDRSTKNYILKKEMFTSVVNMNIVTVSEWLNRIVADSFLNQYPRRVIRNGIDLTTFTPQKCSSSFRERIGASHSKSTLLGVSAAWDDEKGLAEFNRLAEDERFTVILVGVEKREMKRLNRNIIAIPRITDQEELSYYYSVADVFVNPTYNDTYPTVNMESMACGTPVVTYRTGGSPEMLSEETGFVVERGNYSSLESAIKVIIQRGKDYYRDACIKRAHQMFDNRERFSDYLSLYLDIIRK